MTLLGISDEAALYYASLSLLGILFLTTILFLILFTGPGKRKGKREAKGRVESLNDELDKMLLGYRKKGGFEGKGGERECKVNIYYALLSDRENIYRAYEKMSNLSEDIKNEDVKKIYKEIEIKTAEIIRVLDKSKGVNFIKDDIMPYLYIENDPDKSVKILAMYEELSALICKSKETPLEINSRHQKGAHFTL